MMHCRVNQTYMMRVVRALNSKDIIRAAERSPERARLNYYLTQKGAHLKALLGNLNSIVAYPNIGHPAWEPKLDIKQLEERSHVISKRLITKKKRSYMEIYFAICSSIVSRPRTLSSIANACYLNFEQAGKYLSQLVSLNMVVELNSGGRKIYKITGKGALFIDTYSKVYELVYDLK